MSGRFGRTVATFYSEKCPELSRIMMMKFLTNFNRSSDADLPPYLHGKICEHCGTVFNASNCNFRIKPKRKRRKKRKLNSRTKGNKTKDDGVDFIPRGSNFLQISCNFCGWKTRHVGTSRVNRGSMRSTDGETEMGCTSETPVLEKWSNSPRGSGTPHSSGIGSKRKKQKTKLKALLAMEKEEADRRTSTSPSLINFLASI